jgi:DNA recombination protein RmuC
MNDVLLIIVMIILAAVAVLQMMLLRRRMEVDLSSVERQFAALERTIERIDRSVRDEVANNRQELSSTLTKGREEQASTLTGFGDSLVRTLSDVSGVQQRHLSTFAEQIAKLTQSNEQKLELVRGNVEQKLELVRGNVEQKLEQVRGNVEQKLEQVRVTVEQRLEAVRAKVEEKLAGIQQDNATRLEEMRKTVDEKLQGTLEKRLGESFKQVSERLEAVYKGLGEMQTLASGVGDLKKVLTNVKSRGTWGEVQLGAMLEQVLTPEQYERNVATTGTRERVEFAVKLPGSRDEPGSVVWLPIDAKFPIESYQRLVEAQEAGDEDAIKRESKALEDRIWQCARDIREKYVAPPATTDFGILYLPLEGLFAEVMRRPGLPEQVQHEYRVMIAGPTTLWSLLNSLQMGFRTLAIQKRTGEVWDLLRAVKTEFEKYGEVLAKVKEKLDDASETIESKVAVRVRAINRKLKTVERFSADDPRATLALETDADDGETNNE